MSAELHSLSYLWLAGNEGMSKNMKSTITGLYRDYSKDPFLHS